MFARVPDAQALGWMLTALMLSLVLVRRRGVRPEDAVTQAYVRMLAVLRARGLERVSSSTPREFLATVPEPVRPHAQEVTEAFERVRYGGAPPSGDEGMRARDAVGRVRAAVGRSKGRVAR